MPKTNIKKFISLALSLISIALFFLVNKYAAGLVAAFALFVVTFSTSKSGSLFSIAVFFASAVLGFVVDYPYSNFPVATITLLLFPLTLHLRTWLFEWVGVRNNWVDFLAFQLITVFFIVDGIFVKYDVFQWVLAGFVVFQWEFFSFVIYTDREGANKMVGGIKTAANSKAPDFTLPDQNGSLVSLHDVLKENHALLIFVRGDWCPTCHMMMRGYVKNKDKFAEKNVRIIGIGPDPQGVNKDVMNRIDPSSLLLSDKDQEIAQLYINNIQENNPVTKSLYKKGIPLPASFLVHMNGNIIFTSRSDKAGEILQPEKIVEVLDTINA
jgi:peroxiredoxin